MDIVAKLRRIDSKLQLAGRTEYSVPVEKQKKFLESLPDPTSQIERSYYQFLCQQYLKNRFTNIVMEIGAFVVYPFLKWKYSKQNAEVEVTQKDAVFLPDGKPTDIIPDSLKDKYTELISEEEKRYHLDKKAKSFIKIVESTYPKAFLFKLKMIVKVARYNYLIEKYNPKSLIVCNEYSFTSAAMSEYCKKCGVILINVMHGEKLFSLQEAFFSFPICYVWSDYYISLFDRVRAKCDEYIVELPDSMIISSSEFDKEIDFTYYLQEEKGDELKTIVDSMIKIRNNGYRVAIRPHPRYTELKNLIGIDIEIEDNNMISISESLTRTRCAISFCSTVLNQAYFNNIDVVIDDLARPSEYKTLLEKEYIITKVEHKLLSDVLSRL